MGLGVGVDCELCGDQLCYGDDTKEIGECTELDERGRQHIIKHPVLCHRCSEMVKKYEEMKRENDS